VSFHGIAFNVAPDLTHFGGITPCGISNPLYGVTSLDDLGLKTTMEDFDTALHLSFVEIFGDAKRVEAPDLSAYQTAA
jgi:lipoyl(octanoyl) transferase